MLKKLKGLNGFLNLNSLIVNFLFLDYKIIKPPLFTVLTSQEVFL